MRKDELDQRIKNRCEKSVKDDYYTPDYALQPISAILYQNTASFGRLRMVRVI